MRDNIIKSLQIITFSSFVILCILLLWQPLFVINLKQSDLQNKKEFDFAKLITISILCGTVIGMILFINDVKTFKDNDEIVEEVIIQEKNSNFNDKPFFSMKDNDFY